MRALLDGTAAQPEPNVALHGVDQERNADDAVGGWAHKMFAFFAPIRTLR